MPIPSEASVQPLRLLCQEKAGDVNRDPGWSSFSGLRLQWHKVKSSDRRGALSFQLNLPRHSSLSSFGRLFVAAVFYGVGLIHIEGAFEESTGIHRFHPCLLFTFECQARPLFLSASVYSFLRGTFYIPGFDFCFSLSDKGQCLFSHHWALNFSLPQCFLVFVLWAPLKVCHFPPIPKVYLICFVFVASKIVHGIFTFYIRFFCFCFLCYRNLLK